MKQNRLPLIVGCSVLLCAAAVTQAASADVHRNIQYAQVGDTALHLDLYLPTKTEAPPPLIVWVHGGAWRQGSKEHCPLVWMTENGYAVASVQYRLTDKATFPAQIHDCKGAIRWLREHADKYRYNAEKIGVAGISAGGHLVALLGTSGDVAELEGDVGGNLDHSSRVQAVLDMCGPSDFLLRLANNPESVNPPDSPVAALLGGPASEKRDLAKLASPASHVTKDDPPLMIFHGMNDPLVSPTQSEHLRNLYEKSDLDVTLELIPNGGHVPREFWDSTRRGMARAFFDEHLTANRAPADATGVRGVVLIPDSVASFKGHSLEIKLWEYDPLLADVSADLIDEFGVESYSHEEGKETETTFRVGGKRKPRQDRRYYITVFVVKDGTRTHIGEQDGKSGLCNVLTQGNPSSVKMIARPVR